MDNKVDQPFWFSFIESALFDTVEDKAALNEIVAERDAPLDRTDRLKVQEAILTALKRDPKAIQSNPILWSLADNTWNPSPVLQSLNTLCTQQGWKPSWSEDAFSVTINDKTFEIPEIARPALHQTKKKQLKAKLGAMILIYHGGVLKKEWAVPK